MIIIVSSMDCCIQSKKLSLWLAAPKMSFGSSSHRLKFKDSVIWSRLIRQSDGPEDRFGQMSPLSLIGWSPSRRWFL